MSDLTLQAARECSKILWREQRARGGEQEATYLAFKRARARKDWQDALEWAEEAIKRHSWKTMTQYRWWCYRRATMKDKLKAA